MIASAQSNTLFIEIEVRSQLLRTIHSSATPASQTASSRSSSPAASLKISLARSTISPHVAGDPRDRQPLDPGRKCEFPRAGGGPSARFFCCFAGNRKAVTTTAGTVTYQYDAANRLTQVGGVSYTWDDAGNLLNDGTFTYTWNAAGRLVMAQNITHTVVYTYNGDGVRVAQNADGVETRWVQDVIAGLPVVLVEIANSKSQVYVYGVGRLAQFSDDAFEWFLDDALGSVRQVAAGDGSILLAQEYDPYGQRLDAAGSGSSGYGYAGEQWDGSTGLIFLRARWFDPRTGRFVSKDPFPGYAGLPQTLNLYSYCLNNPITTTRLHAVDKLNCASRRLRCER